MLPHLEIIFNINIKGKLLLDTERYHMKIDHVSLFCCTASWASGTGSLVGESPRDRIQLSILFYIESQFLINTIVSHNLSQFVTTLKIVTSGHTEGQGVPHILLITIS